MPHTHSHTHTHTHTHTWTMNLTLMNKMKTRKYINHLNTIWLCGVHQGCIFCFLYCGGSFHWKQQTEKLTMRCSTSHCELVGRACVPYFCVWKVATLYPVSIYSMYDWLIDFYLFPGVSRTQCPQPSWVYRTPKSWTLKSCFTSLPSFTDEKCHGKNSLLKDISHCCHLTQENHHKYKT